MSQHYARPLHNKDLVEDFLKNALEFDLSNTRKIISRIVDGEIGVINGLREGQTLNKTELRDRKYKEDKIRRELRNRIVQELISQQRLDDDDKIKLGRGGALPNCPLESRKQAFILIGLPASGKSSIASTIAEDHGAIIIDSDFAKRKLPEYREHLYGASIVHEESSSIMDAVYEHCLVNGHNLIIPKIGHSAQKIIPLASTLKVENGYAVHLILVYLPKREATIRAIYRYNKTRRYVPLGLIFDGYGNDPCMCYYYLRCQHADLFTSFGAISTNVPLGASPICLDRLGETPAQNYPPENTIFF